ncbi:hypothetical protein CAEBREN_15363 [Caenorhabditis brenneri]|uniref:RING-type domain-containing protein n=1 Tax=Caenorhabditis brenneri TaxID=135651 RepID=G0PK60_CAEBE|nr:hypothetical protein CAEBREN_15363 [Caenorhabditis brenneri]
MLYFPPFYCLGPNHNEEIVWFDEKLHKPVSGVCRHTVCLQCQTENPHMKCPTCHKGNSFFNQEPNYQVMLMMIKFRSGLLQMLETWWKGEEFGIGACSNCLSKSKSLRLCLECHSNLYHKDQESPALILEVESFQDLMKLSRKVFCSACAFSQHYDKGHRIKRVEDFHFDKRNIKTITAKEILAMLRLEIDHSFEIKIQTNRNEDTKIEEDLKCLEYRTSKLLDRKVDPNDPKKLRESVRHALVELHIKDLIKKTKKLIDSFGPCELADVPERQCTLCVSSDDSEETRVREILNDYVRDYKNNKTVDMVC